MESGSAIQVPPNIKLLTCSQYVLLKQLKNIISVCHHGLNAKEKCKAFRRNYFISLNIFFADSAGWPDSFKASAAANWLCFRPVFKMKLSRAEK